MLHLSLLLGMVCCTLAAIPMATRHDPPVHWDVHDEERPQPPAVDPGSAPKNPRSIPSDATVLLDGTSLDGWTHMDGSPADWNVVDGTVEVAPGTGDIQTRHTFGDVQLHVEWAAPSEVIGEGQGRGNSGVFLMDHYEVQVLDSYENPTYADGLCAAIYGQYPPLVNACRPPGAWQTFDITFRRPHFDENGNVVRPARITVIHNGVLAIDNAILTGPTDHQARPPYTAHDPRLPLRLQDHGDRVRFRNVWVRKLE